MKLISFVAISFLAITVSAYPGLGTPPQSPRRFDQGEIQAELDRLGMDYEQKQWDELKLKYDKQYQIYKKVRKVREYAKAVLDLMTENQQLIADRNFEYKVETGPSPGSFYDIGLLKDQNDKILRKIEDLLEKQKGIMAAIGAMGGSKRDLMAQSDELKDMGTVFASSA
ncbi:hypothetical protein BASA60_005141 [Batrachochytrium salamandrivorans]|nr:hypothetical protein BASA60_005141 [Batrachochytrium salamandrivorans]